ncbi:MAG: hypothetical protein ACLU77_15125 [Waltera sp.]
MQKSSRDGVKREIPSKDDFVPGDTIALKRVTLIVADGRIPAQLFAAGQ